MDLRLKFNEDAAAYDEWRPSYVAALYDDLFEYKKINKDSAVLEVGIGTGQATLPFLKRCCRTDAVELGEALAAYTRMKYERYENLHVLNMEFEAYACADNTYDLVYSASAFHWIPEEVGYPKVYRMLKKGGAFARFANHPYKDKENEPLHLAIQEIYAKYMPESKLGLEYNGRMARQRADISRKYGFIDIGYKLYQRTRVFQAEEYAALLSTYSDHRALGEAALPQFQKEICHAIHRFGGKIKIYDTIDLQLARKP